jgi:hypothetical protein
MNTRGPLPAWRTRRRRSIALAGACAVAVAIGLLTCCSSNTPPTSSPVQGAAGIYASPQGLSTNDGSAARPLDLATALSHQGPAKPGNTIWLRGGTYRGGFISSLEGTAEAPIVVRPVAGERVILDGNHPDAQQHGITLQVLGSHVRFWGLEVTYTGAARTDTGNPSSPNGIYANESTDVKLINLVVHDMPGQGFGVWAESVNVEVYGNIIYNNGTNAFDHGIYTQNATETKRIEDNVIFNQAGHGLHAYGSTEAFLDHFYVSGNVAFNNGLLAGAPQRNILIGGLRVANDLMVANNYTYFPLGLPRGSDNIGYSAGCASTTVTNNVFAGPNALTLINCAPTQLSGNVFSGSLDPPDLASRYPDNAYFPAMPGGVRMIVRPNRYEPGRAHVIVYNWDLQPQVAVDLAPAGLRSGQSFEVRDAQNLFEAPVVSGTYTGAPVNFPMTGLRSATPTWNQAVAPKSSAPEFAVFIILPH